MRRDTSKPEVPWSARIEQHDKETFRALLPIRGGQVWMVTTALEKFLDMCDHDPAVVEKSKELINRHLHEETREGALIEFNVKIPRKLYTRFDDHFPMMGATSWFIRTIVEKVNVQLDGFILDERVEAAVRTIFRESDGTE